LRPLLFKTVIILVLFGALLAGAVFSRPDRSDFERVALPKRPVPRNVIERLFGHPSPQNVLADCDHRNRMLWTDVYLDGRRVATGAFGHWWWTEQGRETFDLQMPAELPADNR
jgi:hypothetical protein